MFSALFVSVSGTRAQAGFTSVWAVDDGEKIFRANLTSPLKNGNSVWNGSSVSLFGVRNEIVAFQLILQADGSGATNADVQISDLTNGGNTIRGSHPLLAANNYVGMGVELFTEHYLNVSVLSGDPNEGYFNWSASAAPSVSGMTTGWMPDATVPFSAASGKGGAPFNITANQNQGVWVDIYIGRTLPAGTYTGTITIKLNGSTYQTIPISLLVLSPTLSDTNHYQSMIAYGGTGDIRLRHNLTCCGADMWQTILDYNRMAHRHRIDLIGSGNRADITYLYGTLTGAAYTSAYNYAGPGEGVGNRVFSVGTYGGWWNQTQSYFQTESDYFINWLNANAPGVDRFLYLVDEPGSDLYPDIKTKCDWIHNNPGPGKALPVLITKHVDDALVGYVDTWCTPTADWNSVTTAAAQARGEHVYTYAAFRPKTTADITDEWGIAYRLKPWIAHQWGVTRWFTWESTHYTRNWNEINPNTAFDVWADPLTFHTSHASETGNGDGVMFYPGRDNVFPAQDRGYNGPIASIRMKMYRRGEQDVEYMWLAEQAGKSAQVQNILQDLLPHTMDNALVTPDWSNSNAPYDVARREFADLAAGTVRAPSARFKASTTRGPATLVVSFTDLSVFSPTSWAWTFGDGGTSTSQNPSHSYSSVGSYTVSLTATNAQGQDSEVKTNYINVIQEVVLYPSSWDSDSYAPTALVSGGLSNLQADDSSYMVLQPTDASKRFSERFYATTSYTPSQLARISIDYDAKRSSSSTPSGGLPYVRKSDNSYQLQAGWLPSTSDTAWKWETTNPANYINGSGGLSFELCGCPNGTTSYTISSDLLRWRLELAQSGALTPVAEFVASPRSGAAPLAVTFTDCSSNTPTSWSWTFGDGSTSTSRNPSHTYSSSGNYNVALTATNSAGSNTCTKNSYISVSGGGGIPVANFTGNPTSGYTPLTVAFTDSSTNSPTSWSWTFGDSSTSTSQNPSHVYSTAGSYTVALTATNSYGSNTNTKPSYITANAPPSPPVANFSGTPTSGNAPLAVTFTDSSTNSPTSWSWTFGDSSTSTSQNPSHTYTSAGSYTVALTATNAGGSNTNTKNNYITVNAPSGAPTFVAAGAVATSTGAITPALPSGIAANDILLLCLETANQAISISNQNGGTWTAVTNSPQGTGTAGGSGATCLTVFWSRYNGTQGAPTTSDSGNHQLGRIIAIRGAATSGNPWDVTAGGVDTSTGTTGSIPGATTTVTNTLVVAALVTALPDADGTADFSAWTNANLTSLTERTDNTSSQGNGGGLGIATGVKAAAGAYGTTTVTCATGAKKGMLSIALKPAGGVSPPVANFSGTPTSGTAPLTVAFTDSSTNSPTSWSWTFGDSSTSTSQNPSHTYSTAGTYTVALTATNSAGSNTNTKTNYITVNSGPTEVYMYPDTWGSTNSSTLISGGLSNLQANDSSYMVVRCNTTDHKYVVWYTADTVYTPSQVSKITIEYVAKTSSSTSPTGSSVCWARQSDGIYAITGGWCPSTSNTTYTWETTAVSTYMDANGVVGYKFCGCPFGTSNYDISSDMLRFKLTLY